MNSNVTPKASVLVVTHDHERFVRQALDSVLMQKTDFDFEIVVADDHSQDSTLAIVKEYQADNHHIRVLASERNVGITRNYQRGFAACRGEYIAVLEGDDFWISPTKLKSLVAFLQQHQECALCFHRFIRHDEASDRFTVYPTLETGADFVLLTASQLASGNFIANFSTCVYRREVIDRLDPSLFEMKVYDWMFNITVAQAGMIGYVPEIMSVYRAHSASIWSSRTDDEHKPELLELIDDYNKHLDYKFDKEFQACKFALLSGTALPMGRPLKPRVSVLLVTHNQEKFIHQALNSVTMQKTNFDFEIVVADDHSDDSTLAIVREYQANSPNIRILPTEEKIGITRNYQRGFKACRGKYVAVLEGDDFWISPKKLELTSAFLDQYPECVLCFHRLIRHDEVSDRIMVHPAFGTKVESVLFTASQLAKENFIGNFSSCTYRRDVIDKLDPGLWQLKLREWPFNIVVAQHGVIGYVPEILSVYRAHSGGIWSWKTQDEQRRELLELIDDYNKYLDYKLDKEFRVFKRVFLSQGKLPFRQRKTESTGLWGLSKYARLRRLIRPLVPPLLVSLARNIYDRRKS